MAVTADFMTRIGQGLGPFSEMAALIAIIIARRTDHTADEEMELRYASLKPKLTLVPGANSGSLATLVNAPDGPAAWLHGLCGLHLPNSGGARKWAQHIWHPVGVTFPTRLDAGEVLECIPADGPKFDHRLHAVRANLSWVERPRRKQILPVYFSALPEPTETAN